MTYKVEFSRYRNENLFLAFEKYANYLRNTYATSSSYILHLIKEKGDIEVKRIDQFPSTYRAVFEDEKSYIIFMMKWS